MPNGASTHSNGRRRRATVTRTLESPGGRRSAIPNDPMDTTPPKNPQMCESKRNPPKRINIIKNPNDITLVKRDQNHSHTLVPPGVSSRVHVHGQMTVKRSRDQLPDLGSQSLTCENVWAILGSNQ